MVIRIFIVHYKQNGNPSNIATFYKLLNSALMDCLVIPIQSRVEEWRKITALLDKDHHKGKYNNSYYFIITT